MKRVAVCVGLLGCGQASTTQDTDAEVGTLATACSTPWTSATYTTPPDDSVAFQALIEAAGYATSSNWRDLSAGNVCGGSEQELVLLKTSHSWFSVLRGPAPHVKGVSLLGGALENTLQPWRAVATGNFDGDSFREVVAVRPRSAQGHSDLVLVNVDSSCNMTDEFANRNVGTVSNSDWVDVAVGNLDNVVSNGSEIVMLRTGTPQLVFTRYNNGTWSTVGSFTLPATTNPWNVLAVGDLDGDGDDEVTVARKVTTGGTLKTVISYRWSTSLNNLESNFFASSKHGNTGNSDWKGATAGDFNGASFFAGDKDAVVLVKQASPNFVMFDWSDGGTVLHTWTADLDSATGSDWRGVAAVDWLTSDNSNAELLAVRAPATQPSYYSGTDLFVYGSSFHRQRRDAALADTKAQESNYNTGMTTTQLKEALIATRTNTYNWIVRDQQSYLDLVEFLVDTGPAGSFPCIDGNRLRVWVTLWPPSASVPDEYAGCTDASGLPTPLSTKCSIPSASSLTLADEASYFPGGLDEDSCYDYLGWASLIGALAQQYPQIVALNIDDFSSFPNIKCLFTPDYVADLESRLRTTQKWLNFVPTFYYDLGSGAETLHGNCGNALGQGDFVGYLWPDLPLTLDSMLFYFANDRLGECENEVACGVPEPDDVDYCIAGPPIGGSGTCAEATVPNAAVEINCMSGILPAGRKLQVGLYFYPTSAGGEPSIDYDYELMDLVRGNTAVGGTTSYQAEGPKETCATPLQSKYCVLQDMYAADAGP